MEKKQYTAPATTVTLVAGCTLMAGSLNPNQASGTLGVSNEEDTNKNSWAEAKRYDVWTDEE